MRFDGRPLPIIHLSTAFILMIVASVMLGAWLMAMHYMSRDPNHWLWHLFFNYLALSNRSTAVGIVLVCILYAVPVGVLIAVYKFCEWRIRKAK